MKPFLFILLVFFLFKQGFACRCDQWIQNRDSVFYGYLRSSDLVFTGELIKREHANDYELAYQFRILEIFKGKYTKNVVNGNTISMCSIIPKEPGRWIVFANFSSDSTIEIHQCSPTYPLNASNFKNIPNYYMRKPSDFQEMDLIIMERRMELITNWMVDLERLRKYKEEQTSLISHPSIKNLLIGLLFFTNVILLFAVFYLWRKINKA